MLPKDLGLVDKEGWYGWFRWKGEHERFTDEYLFWSWCMIGEVDGKIGVEVGDGGA